MTPKEIAKHFNVTRRTVYRWIEKKCPATLIDDGTLNPSYDLDLAEVAAWRKSQWSNNQ